MPVPDFQTLMRPLLEEYAAGDERLRFRSAFETALSAERAKKREPSSPTPTRYACLIDVAGEAPPSPPVNTRGAKAAVDPSASRAVKRSASAQGETCPGLTPFNP